MGRAVQMIRTFKPLRKLRVMLYSILACLQSLGWAAFLLYLFVCIMALYLEDVALYHVQIHNIKGVEASAEWETIKSQIYENWSSMYDAQMSLLYSVTGGADWGDMAEPFCSINRVHC